MAFEQLTMKTSTVEVSGVDYEMRDLAKLFKGKIILPNDSDNETVLSITLGDKTHDEMISHLQKMNDLHEVLSPVELNEAKNIILNAFSGNCSFLEFWSCED